MYRQNALKTTNLSTNNSTEGSTIENKIERIINNKEAITDGAPIIFTEKKEGVMKAYNIRTDRFEVAIDGIDKIQKSYQARREEKAKLTVVKEGNSAETEPTQGTGN